MKIKELLDGNIINANKRYAKKLSTVIANIKKESTVNIMYLDNNQVEDILLDMLTPVAVTKSFLKENGFREEDQVTVGGLIVEKRYTHPQYEKMVIVFDQRRFKFAIPNPSPNAFFGITLQPITGIHDIQNYCSGICEKNFEIDIDALLKS